MEIIEKIRKEIERRIHSIENCPFIIAEFGAQERENGEVMAYKDILAFLDSLQAKEPDKSLEEAANALLDALAKTPYNNKPITDAQIIVKQMLIFLSNPSDYNPDAINEKETPELEEEIDKTVNECTDGYNFDWDRFARHFYEFGQLQLLNQLGHIKQTWYNEGYTNGKPNITKEELDALKWTIEHLQTYGQIVGYLEDIYEKLK